MIQMKDYIMFDSLIGLTVNEAKDKLAKFNMTLRVTSHNGEGRVGTSDFDTSRLNVEIEQDKVSKIVGRG